MNISVTLLYILCGISILLEILGFYIILDIKRKIKSDSKRSNEVYNGDVSSTSKHDRILTATTRPNPPTQTTIENSESNSRGVNEWELIMKGNGDPYFIIVEWSDGSHDVLTGKTPTITNIIHPKNLHPVRISNQSVPHLRLSYEWKLNGFHWA